MIYGVTGMWGANKLGIIKYRIRESVARRKREWFPGAMYHIMYRGVRRFKEDIRSVASTSRR